MDRIEIKLKSFSVSLTGLGAIVCFFGFALFVILITRVDPSIAVSIMSLWKKLGA